jgi:hypothetical protein
MGDPFGTFAFEFFPSPPGTRFHGLLYWRCTCFRSLLLTAVPYGLSRFFYLCLFCWIPLLVLIVPGSLGSPLCLSLVRRQTQGVRACGHSSGSMPIIELLV